MRPFTRNWWSARTVVLLLGLWSAGCGKQPTTIRGRVTLDEEALAGATLAFLPTAQGVEPIVARTDEDGGYRIESGSGFVVKPGRYLVRITTYDEGNRDVIPPILPVPERVPTRYNLDSTLVVEITPDANEFDFSLEAKQRDPEDK